MAITIKDLKLSKPWSERGYRIYRLGDTKLGILCHNYYPNMSAHWIYKLTKIEIKKDRYSDKDKYFDRGNPIELGASVSRGKFVVGEFKRQIPILINEKLPEIFQWLFKS